MALSMLSPKPLLIALGVDLRVTTKSTLSSLLLSVGGPQGDFAAANLVSTADRGKSLSFSSPYHQVVQQLIYRAGEKQPQSIDRLTRRFISYCQLVPQ